MSKQLQDPFEGLRALPPFPLVLVTASGNVMTAAAFHFYSFSPPSVMVGIRPEHLTCRLIAEAGEFGVNLPTVDQLEAVRACGAASGRATDKFAQAVLTPQPSSVIGSPLVAECPVSLECRVVHEIDYPGSHRWFVGRIEAAHVDPEYTRDQALTYWLTEYRAVGSVLLKRHV